MKEIEGNSKTDKNYIQNKTFIWILKSFDKIQKGNNPISEKKLDKEEYMNSSHTKSILLHVEKSDMSIKISKKTKISNIHYFSTIYHCIEGVKFNFR